MMPTATPDKIRDYIICHMEQGLQAREIATKTNAAFGLNISIRAMRKRLWNIRKPEAQINEYARRRAAAAELNAEAVRLFMEGVSEKEVTRRINEKFGTTKHVGVISRTITMAGVRQERAKKFPAGPSVRKVRATSAHLPPRQPGVYQKRTRTAPAKIVDLFPAPVRPVTFREIEPGQCFRVVGEPKGLDTIHCGAPALAGKRWCEDCNRIVYGGARALDDLAA